MSKQEASVRVPMGIVFALTNLTVVLDAQTPAHVIFYGSGDSRYSGEQVSGGGDIDGDGVPDFVNTRTLEPQGDGLVDLYSGKTGQRIRIYTTYANHPIQIANVHDLDGDGQSDLAVGNDIFSPPGKSGAGEATIYSGNTGAILWRIEGTSFNQNVGRHVASAGDVNGDGVDDVYVAESGFVASRSGVDGAVLSSFAPNYFSSAGSPIVNIGDVNLDGIPDTLVGWYTAFSNKGQADVYSGANKQLLLHYTGAVNLEALGILVSAIGDVDQDGRSDFVIGGTNASGIRIHSGANGNTLVNITAASSAFIGAGSVAAAGDVNGDGRPDLLVGQVVGSLGAPNGKARIVSGLDGSDLFSYAPPYTQSLGLPSFGYSTDRVGDVDGDGLDEFIVGAYADHSTRNLAGSFTIFSTVPSAGWSNYGTGTAGCQGPMTVRPNVTPRIGERRFAIEAFATPSPTVAKLSQLLIADVSDIPGSDPLGLGYVFHVDVLNSTHVIALDASNYFNFHTAVAAPIRPSPSLAGITYYAQLFSVWNGTCSVNPTQVSSSNGLMLTIQP